MNLLTFGSRWKKHLSAQDGRQNIYVYAVRVSEVYDCAYGVLFCFHSCGLPGSVLILYCLIQLTHGGPASYSLQHGMTLF